MTQKVITAEIVAHGTVSTPIPDEYSNVRYALKITFEDNQVVWVPSHDDVIPLLISGSSYTEHARIAEGVMPNINRNAGFVSGTSTISTPTYRVVDIDNELSDLIANKNANGVGTYNAGISEFEFSLEVGSLHYVTPKYTGSIQNHEKPFDVISFETADINHDLDVDILDPKIWRLNSAITADQDTIPTTLPVVELADNQFLFEHTDTYLANPSETVGYCRIEKTGEVFSYTAFENVGGVSTFTGVTREVLGTIGDAVAVTATDAENKKPELMEWSVLHESATTMIEGMITGNMNGRQMPAHWSANAPLSAVNTLALAEHATVFSLQFQNYGKVKCRSFYEEEILAPMRAVMVTDGLGRLNWTPSVLPVDEDAGEIVLDESNSVTDNEITLRHVKDDIYPSIQINTDWNPFAEEYLTPVIYQDRESASHNKLSLDRKKEYSFKGIHLGIHTGPQIRRLAAAFGDDHFYEKQGLTLESYINDIALGTLVTVQFDNVRDDATGFVTSEPLKRTMMVTESTEDRANRTTVYELSGSMYAQSSRQAGQALHNMSAAEMRRNRINIATLPGISIENGYAAGSVTLHNGREYYYVDENETGEGLEFTSSLNVAIDGTGPCIKLFVFGPFINRTTLDFAAKSHHRVGTAGTSTQPPTVGESGYALSSRSSGAINTERLYGALLSSDEYFYPKRGFRGNGGSRGIYTRGKNARAPDVVLDLNYGILGGIPSDLSGTSGPGSPASSHHDKGKRPYLPTGQTEPSVPSTQWLEGTDGGKGGGGLVIVSWGGGNASGGQIILSGGYAGLTVDQVEIAHATVKGSRGGGGGPGSLLWIVDGGVHAPPLIGPADVLAYHGDGSISGTPFYPLDSVSEADTGTYKTHLPATERTNHYEAVTRIVYTPEAENVSSRIGNAVDLFFQNQRDGQVELIVQEFRPSNANVGDMWITPDELNGGSSTPNAQVLDNTGWRRLDWSTDNRVYEFLLFANREFDGNTVHYGTTRPTIFDDGDLWRDPNQDVTWVLHTDRDDEVLTRSGVQVGDERFVDPNFVLSSLSGAPYTQHWFITSDKDALPTVTVAGKSVATGGDTLQPPFNVLAAVYGRTSAELFWSRPSDVSGITSFEIYLNGALIDTTADNTAEAYLYEGLIAETTYTLGVRSISGAEYSLTQSQVVVTDPEVASGASIVSVTVSGGFVEGTPPTGTDGSPTITLGSSGPTIVLNTTNVEDTRQVYISFTGGDSTQVVVTSNQASYTPAVPANYAGQNFSAYVENAAGQGVSITNIAYTSA